MTDILDCSEFDLEKLELIRQGFHAAIDRRLVLPEFFQSSNHLLEAAFVIAYEEFLDSNGYTQRTSPHMRDRIATYKLLASPSFQEVYKIAQEKKEVEEERARNKAALERRQLKSIPITLTIAGCAAIIALVSSVWNIYKGSQVSNAQADIKVIQNEVQGLKIEALTGQWISKELDTMLQFSDGLLQVSSVFWQVVDTTGFCEILTPLAKINYELDGGVLVLSNEYGLQKLNVITSNMKYVELKDIPGSDYKKFISSGLYQSYYNSMIPIFKDFKGRFQLAIAIF